MHLKHRISLQRRQQSHLRQFVDQPYRPRRLKRHVHPVEPPLMLQQQTPPEIKAKAVRQTETKTNRRMEVEDVHWSNSASLVVGTAGDLCVVSDYAFFSQSPSSLQSCNPTSHMHITPCFGYIVFLIGYPLVFGFCFLNSCFAPTEMGWSVVCGTET